MAEEIITQEMVKALFNYDPLTGIFTWAKKRSGYQIGQETGSRCIRTGYVKLQVYGKRYLAHRIAWLYVHGKLPTHSIDHINRLKHDNRIENLRDVPHVVNSANTGARKKARYNLKGVKFIRRTQSYKVEFVFNGEKHFLGEFADRDIAQDTYNKFMTNAINKLDTTKT
jgi:hypothetical protein